MFNRLAQTLRSARSWFDVLAATISNINLIKNGQCVATGENEVLTRIFTGQLMYVDRRDVSVAPHLMLSGIWEHEITQHFRSYVRSDTVVFDVGANFGFFGIVAGTHNPEGQLHLFEANPVFDPLIRKSLVVNGLDSRSTVTSAAITQRSGEALTLNLVKDLWGGSSLHPRHSNAFIHAGGTVETTGLSLDDYCEHQGIRRVDLIKLDIEGFEKQAFDGMKRLLEANPQVVVFMEWTLGAYTPGFFGSLQDRFRVSALVGNAKVEVKDEGHLGELGKGWIMLVLEPS